MALPLLVYAISSEMRVASTLYVGERVGLVVGASVTIVTVTSFEVAVLVVSTVDSELNRSAKPPLDVSATSSGIVLERAVAVSASSTSTVKSTCIACE